ncbi:AzlC family ABC transporter permease [Paenibacillus tepidiphilus]|uniref:AzlC family ABC transporter permease n=1 Tax=Paenibacillus tepidiphilus TaxID=2608683 RepID=UPI0013A5A1B2|nr:AzlC family ABC transporter permease [Paenibacillus tepidiphilus]
MQDTLKLFKKGIIDSAPIVIGYIPACITFGLVGKALSLSDLEVFLLSAVVYAGASQFIAANLLALGTAAPIVLLLTFVINLRYLFIGMSFASKMKRDTRVLHKGLVGFGLTEEVYAVSMMKIRSRNDSSSHSLPYVLGMEFPPYTVNLISTCAGIMLSGYIPADILPALNTSLYALLIALVIPQIRRHRKNLAICISAAASSWCLQPLLGTASVLAAMAIGAAVGAMFPFKKETVRSEAM